MSDTNSRYAEAYRGIDFREEPGKYKIGRGEQGVLIAEPYKSELLPHWKFATPTIAEESAKTIYGMFESYGKKKDFVGMDMARKYLQMGFTRSRRYANHPSGNKYDKDRAVKKQDKNAQNSSKAKAAKIFLGYYEKALENELYLKLKEQHQSQQETV